MKIKFLGAATSVTGSCYLITTDKTKFILDCGQYQGGKVLEQQNYDEFGFDPRGVDFMILSHAHIDHSGRIPLLVKKGFKGKIYCTNATADLVDIMLKDSAYIHEKEAQWDNKKLLRSGKRMIQPLYTMKDAERSLENISPSIYDQYIEPTPNIKFRFRDAGHILGSAIVEIWIEEEGKVNKLVFSGDLGMKNKPILNDPTVIEEADYLIMETTYGNRNHESPADSLVKFIDILLKTIKRGGTVVIPSFAVGRTQELIYQLNMCFDQDAQCHKGLENINVYIDSPLAISATEIFRRNAQDFDEETRNYILSGDNPLDFKNLKFVRSSEESKELNFNKDPKIIISTSGMCEAGRIKHHLKHNLWNEKASIVIVGYQAPDTLGRLLVEGLKDVYIFGEKIHVAAEVYSLEGFSGHADKDGLYEWISGFKKAPKRVFFVHGEDDSKVEFAKTVRDGLGFDCQVIDHVAEYDLATDKGIAIEKQEMQLANEAELIAMKKKLVKIQDELDKIVDSTNQALEKGMLKDRLDGIGNVVLGIEGNAIQLGALVTKEEK